MAVVTRGLGLPEEGSLVAFGLGRSALVGADVTVPAVTVGGLVVIPGAAVLARELRNGSPWGSVPITPILTAGPYSPPTGSSVDCLAVGTGETPIPFAATATRRSTASHVAATGGTKSRVTAARHSSTIHRLPFDSRVETETPTSEVGT